MDSEMILPSTLRLYFKNKSIQLVHRAEPAAEQNKRTLLRLQFVSSVSSPDANVENTVTPKPWEPRKPGV